MLTSLIGLMTTLTSLMGLSAENYSRCWSKTLGKRSGEDKVERVKCTRWVMEEAKFAFKLKLHCRGGIYMQAGLAIWKLSTSGDTNSCNYRRRTLLHSILDWSWNSLSELQNVADIPGIGLKVCFNFCSMWKKRFLKNNGGKGYHCLRLCAGSVCGDEQSIVRSRYIKNQQQPDDPFSTPPFDSCYVTNCHSCCLTVSIISPKPPNNPNLKNLIMSSQPRQ